MDDVEKIRARLKELGIPFGGDWGETNAQTNIESPIVTRQKEALGKVQGLLEDQVEQDQVRVAHLLADLQRLKHGGGS